MAIIPWAKSRPQQSGMAGSDNDARPKRARPEPTRRESALPPPGPSNIIVLTPNPWPPPRNVRSQ